MSSTLALDLAPDVTRAARGDQQAFTRLVNATSNTVTSITLAILRDIEMSRDVAQEVYLMVWRDLGKLRDPSSFLPWLRQIARNRAHQALRTHVRRTRRFAAGTDDLLAAAADARPNALDLLIDADQRAALAQAIAELPDVSREVVILYYREGQSAAQVAALLDLSEDAVKQRLSRARRTLASSVSRLLADTVPGVAFATAVAATISSMAAPAVAGATVIGASNAGKAGTGAVSLLSAAAFGAVAGLAGSWLGILFGTRRLLDVARDDEERRGVLISAALGMSASLAFVISILLRPTPLTATVAFGVMMMCMLFTHFFHLPRVTRRRKEAELREDPMHAAVRHARERRQARLGMALGSALGGAAVAASWFFT